MAGNVGVQLEHGLLFDHDPGNPRIGDGELEEPADDRTGAEAEELDTEGKDKEDASREDVARPFQSHGFFSFEIIYHLLHISELKIFYFAQLHNRLPQGGVVLTLFCVRLTITQGF